MHELKIDLSKFGITATCSRIARQEDIARELILSFTTKFTTERQDPFVYHTPKNWFEHLKQAILPNWLLKRWPAKSEKHEVTVQTVYPFLKTKIPPELQGPFVCVVLNNVNINSFLSDTEGIDRMEWRNEVVPRLMKEQWSDLIKCPTCQRRWFEK